MNNYDENNYLDQYGNLKLFQKKYVGEQLLSPIISYDKIRTCFFIQIIDLRIEVDHVTPTKIRLFDEYDGNPVNTVS